MCKQSESESESEREDGVRLTAYINKRTGYERYYCLEIEIKIKIMVKNNVQDAIATVDLLAGK